MARAVTTFVWSLSSISCEVGNDASSGSSSEMSNSGSSPFSPFPPAGGGGGPTSSGSNSGSSDCGTDGVEPGRRLSSDFAAAADEAIPP